MRLLPELDHAYLLACNENSAVASLGCTALEIAARQGNCSAMLHLASIHELGNGGVVADCNAAERWLQLVRDLLPTLSACDDLYSVGVRSCWDARLGLTKSEALKLLLRASEQGHPAAFWEMYEQTRHENPLNFDRRRILELAAQGLYPQALSELAVVIGRFDSEYSITLLRAAEALGDLRAVEMLADGPVPPAARS